MGDGKMLIKKIKVSNFKSFDELDIELGSFNVLIGANASGKSNFLTILKFLKDIAESGLNNAISMQGGIEYIRNVKIGDSKDILVELYIDSNEVPVSFGYMGKKDEMLVGILANEFRYKFGIKSSLYGEKIEYRVVGERLVVNCEFVELEKKEGELREKRKVGVGEINLTSRDDGTVKHGIKAAGELPIKMKDSILPLSSEKGFSEKKLSPNELFLETPLFFPSLILSDFFRDISIYNFDPKLSKEATPVTGKAELEPNGKNLAIVIKNILNDETRAKSMSALMKDLLPFIEDLRVERLADKSLLVSLEEVYHEKKFLPAPLMSDGTINITALIIALYFERKPLIAIEEPERNIHPHLISKIVDMMKDVSERFEKQIIVTTHNPEMVKYAGIENILLVHRDDNGFSQISRPSEKEEVKIFLKNEMGIEELYVQNLLEW